MLSPKLKQIVHPTTVYSEAQVSIVPNELRCHFSPHKSQEVIRTLEELTAANPDEMM
jgi:hypothetical protein